MQSEANLQTSVRAVRAMAEFASQKPNLFGIQVISEPHLHTDEGHEFLRRYYQQAILAARESLDPTVPVVLFEWTYEMHRWEEGAFPESTYGRVVWDTHLYHFPEPGQKWTSKENGLEKAKEAYASRYPSSTLFPFIFWGLLSKAEYQEKKCTLIIKGLPGNPNLNLRP